jgi:hypothetical protein
MSRFYANIKGNRGEATRCGTKGSGIHGHIRAWNIGVHVECYTKADGKDACSVRITGGSSNSLQIIKNLGEFIEKEV